MNLYDSNAGITYPLDNSYELTTIREHIKRCESCWWCPRSNKSVFIVRIVVAYQCGRM